MPINSSVTIFRASYVLPIDSPLISDGAIKIKGNRIVEVSSFSDITKTRKDKLVLLPGFLIMPGFVNAHTHLELSCLKGITRERHSFSKWILEVIDAKKKISEKDYEKSIESGILESIKGGITTFGDISGTGFTPKVMKRLGARGVVFHEIIGFKEKNAVNAFYELCMKVAISKSLLLKEYSLIDIGLSPHSSYSVSPYLFKLSSDLAKRLKLPVSIHLAETEEEIRFLKKGNGPFKALLSGLNSFDKKWKAPVCSPLKYLYTMNVFTSKTSIVHFNFFDNEDLKIAKKLKIKVIFCPKSNNEWFERKSSPLIDCLQNSIPVSLGTDSLASNNCYNMFDEMRMLKSFHPSICSEKILQIATLGGAFCIGLKNKTGSLAPGKFADFIAVKIPEKVKPENLAEYLVREKKEVCLSVINGQVVYNKLSIL
ncbi:MAG: hypothetical protein A3C43_09260 [Candidatus Schekmanbacteria bacterium RIFCSPHIGHO2_02_FULL_38_11]|uniref:Amidohydrolase-related domain-containing protein n=1 Tax=Candidatus Schekmanbacteria bacterium RIFCSPLOWO2_12_FULL_38_15 TaxID=1817883 RepID=A0A1F7SE53_9BACT|nr:MAG: hypothetical protein A2043_00795 [Candidatus Schekmanbacteria bacterium GWA2_38_9]OGL49077.1 MAG: hypothetical protein A3H37_03845 [Candidatus Schekmanbacteria bacterium RIFCSPLOWO2_02_FULL_38_14]OGL49202.1 MAG: hypothetical protein A3C43_09260 [Candidatus Schekmanbacteria bacterium RIFCSPHIGHO2_02_FULL_38_11]OGL52052.1 MAG: hypothetical protein A3G31_06430 [Candidatus Schekmanbacteria bacterium RIFCSPLOWO2_12_FULL_38_15]